MYKLCKTEQSAARQRELEAGLLSVMEVRRYEDISISELCDHLQIPRKSFYRYFSSKDGALHALLDHTLLEFERVADVYLVGKNNDARPNLERFFYFWQSQKRLLDALERSSLSGLLVMRAISQAQQENQVPNHYLTVEARELRAYAITFAVTGLMSMVLEWHHAGYNKTPKEMAQVAAMMLSHPLIHNA